MEKIDLLRHLLGDHDSKNVSLHALDPPRSDESRIRHSRTSESHLGSAHHADRGEDNVVVISVTDENRKLTQEQGERLVGQAKKLLGPDTKVIVLPYGLAISKIEKDEVST